MIPRKVPHSILVDRPASVEPLRCYGVGRDAENPQSIAVAFSRALTDAEMRIFHDICRRAALLVTEGHD